MPHRPAPAPPCLLPALVYDDPERRNVPRRNRRQHPAPSERPSATRQSRRRSFLTPLAAVLNLSVTPAGAAATSSLRDYQSGWGKPRAHPRPEPSLGVAAAFVQPRATRDPPSDGALPHGRDRGWRRRLGALESDGFFVPVGEDEDEEEERKREKRLLLIRHGCTHMNEYLAIPGCRWGDPGFTDVFPSPPPRDEDGAELYRDSPLSPRGIRQARRLADRVGHLLRGKAEGRPYEDVDMGLDEEHQDVLAELELIAVSPLTRALQTVELGLMGHIEPAPLPVSSGEGTEGEMGGVGVGGIPVVALPLASERVYLISDVGSDVGKLSRRFPYIDFSSEVRPYHPHVGDEWWFTLSGDDHDESDLDNASEEGMKHSLLPPPTLSTYEEWRPSSEGQTYAHPGEPDDHFHSRMVALYDWIDRRPEDTIALVCHWGVLQWLSGEDFENCEMKVVRFCDMDRDGLMPGKKEGEERLSKVGRGSEEEVEANEVGT